MPTQRGTGGNKFGAGDEGNAHSAWTNWQGNILVQADEDFDLTPNPDVETGWGYGHIYDISDKANPVELATLKLPSTHQFPPPGPADFTIHDPKITGKRLYTSWYTEGVAVWNIANPSSPQIIGQFIPPENAEDPLGLFYPGEEFVEIWGRHRLRLRRRFRHEHRPLGVPRALISAQDHVFDARAGSQNPALALAARRESNL